MRRGGSEDSAAKEDPGIRLTADEEYLPGDDVVVAREAGRHGCVGDAGDRWDGERREVGEREGWGGTCREFLYLRRFKI